MDKIITDLTHQLRLAMRKLETCQCAAIRHEGDKRHVRAREAQMQRILERAASLSLAIETLRPLECKEIKVLGHAPAVIREGSFTGL
jgi:hypothetical protein